MSEITYNKLVRDRIPDIIEADNRFPITHVLDEKQYVSELEKKLLEECDEVLDSDGYDRLEELADVYEVLSALAAVHGSDIEEIIEIAKDKSEKRGGFSQRIYLEKVVD